ncbi:MAG: hypothetical protein ACOZAO_03870 [Patescibacteria group bacterium]
MFDAYNTDFHVLHASSSVSESGKVVLFGDDGIFSVGKTFCSLLLAAQSGIYVSDEYCLLDKYTLGIYGNGDIPLNLKGDTASYIMESFQLKLKDSKVIYANDYFKIVPSSKINYVVIPYMCSEKSSIEPVSDTDQKASIAKGIVYGHNVKFLQPEFDRVSILRNEQGSLESNMSTLLNAYPVPNFPFDIVRMYVKNPDDILPMIKEIEHV